MPKKAKKKAKAAKVAKKRGKKKKAKLVAVTVMKMLEDLRNRIAKLEFEQAQRDRPAAEPPPDIDEEQPAAA